ncbi:hypothetical protein [Rossellomorea marisflavi]|uniref:hypothetical protein n=1 Tax=Rossellomorea marisflavi TaxID=189381 RepID=UPI003FA1603A
MENYILNKVLLFLFSLCILAFGMHFYGKVPSTWIAWVMIAGYLTLLGLALSNERKYKDQKPQSKPKKNKNVDNGQ